MGKTETGGRTEDSRLLLERVLRVSESDPELQVTCVEAVPACSQGDNFMSAVSRLVVSVQTVKRFSSKKSFLMKRHLESEERRAILRCGPAFRNEGNAYQVVVPALEGFTYSRLPFPECLHAASDCLILEDLKVAGFRMADRRRGLDFLQASLAIKKLGRFHGISLAMKMTDPRRFNKVKTSVQEFLFVPASAPYFGHVLECSLNTALTVLKANRGKNNPAFKSVIDTLENLKGSLFQKLLQIVSPKEPLAVICHGDFYINNMLFRYNEMEIPEEVRFVDLQACRYSTLATDLLYFFGSSLEKGLLSAHHDTFFQMYSASLEDELSRTGSHLKAVSLKDIQKEVKECSLFGLIMGILLLPAVTAKPGAFNEHQEKLPTEEEVLRVLSPEYSERLEDLVLTFSKLGYI